MSTSAASEGGGGILGLLGVAFIVLKLTHVIDWSWWYVTIPFWGGLAAVLGILALVSVVAVAIAAIDRPRSRKP